MCTWFDETCGQLLDHVEARGLTNNTIVILVTDNGWIQLPDKRGFAPRSKRTAYEAGVRTPILVSWPGTIEPAERSVPVSTVDLAPTILAACGAEVPDSLPGVNLLERNVDHGPVFGAAYTHDVVDIDHPERSLVTRWVLSGDHKLLVHTDPDRKDELYNVVADPFEEKPLTDEETSKKLRAKLDGWWPAGG